MKRGRMPPIQRKLNRRAMEWELVRILNENFREPFTEPPKNKILPKGTQIDPMAVGSR